jgi:N-acetylneuraminic acid mutarotase
MAASELSATKRARLAEEPTTVELSGGAAHPAEFVAFCCDHDDSFTDIVIRVEHKAFVAHRNVLAAASPFMRVHLKQQNFADSGTRELVISDLSAVAFEVALEFVYKGKATLKDDTRLQSVLEAASRLEIAPLLEAVSAAIQHRLTCANSVDIWDLAERYSLPMLETAARRMCLRRFEALVENPSFLGLSRERLLALVSDDELSVKSERIVFEAVLQWARHHGATSDGQLAELLAPVRFGFMPREQLQYVLSEPLVKASPMVLIDVASALADKHDATPQMARSSPRQGCQLIYLIGFSSKDGTKDSPVYGRLCKRFDPVTSAVTSIAPLPEYHDAVSAAALGGNIYVVASIVDKFTWDREGRFLLDRGRMAMLRYDEAKDEWRTLSPPTTYHGEARACAAALDCKIYLAGGGNPAIADVEAYDPTTDTWQPVAPMNVARRYFGLVAAQGCLFAIGGMNDGDDPDEASVEKYDPKTNAWTLVRAMPRGMNDMAAAVVGSGEMTAIVTIGGEMFAPDGGVTQDGEDVGTAVTDACYAYYPDVDEWEPGVSGRLPCAAAAIGVAEVGGTLWLFGGFDRHDHDIGTISCQRPGPIDPLCVHWGTFEPITAVKHLEMPPGRILCVADA